MVDATRPHIVGSSTGYHFPVENFQKSLEIFWRAPRLWRLVRTTGTTSGRIQTAPRLVVNFRGQRNAAHIFGGRFLCSTRRQRWAEGPRARSSPLGTGRARAPARLLCSWWPPSASAREPPPPPLDGAAPPLGGGKDKGRTRLRSTPSPMPHVVALNKECVKELVFTR